MFGFIVWNFDMCCRPREAAESPLPSGQAGWRAGASGDSTGSRSLWSHWGEPGEPNGNLSWLIHRNTRLSNSARSDTSTDLVVRLAVAGIGLILFGIPFLG